MNKLLERQLRRSSIAYRDIPEDFQKLLIAVNASYDHYEADRSLLERSIDLSSLELTEAYKKLRVETERQKIVLDKLKSAISSLRHEDEVVFTSEVIEDEDLISISDILTSQIQKRKEAEDKLILYERAINSGSNGILITDPNLPDNPIVFCNPAYLKATGYSLEEVLGKNGRILQREDNDQEGLRILRASIKKQESCTVTVRNYRKDGTMFWNDLRISPIFNSKGKLTNFIGVQTDVTNRIEFERQLKTANSRISALIQSLQSGILVEDENRRIVVSNQEFCTMFGIPYSPENLIGYDCVAATELSKVLFQDPVGFVEDISKILEDKKVVKGEELNLADGRVFERDYIPIFISKDYSGHLWQYRDITEKKNAEKKLLESEKLFRHIIDNAGEIIYRIDPNGIFTYVNPTAVRIMGFSVDELVGKHYLDFVREDFVKRMMIFYKNQITSKTTSTYFEFPAVKKSGEIVWLGQNVQIIFGDQEIVGLQSVARDITERVLFEGEIQRLKSFYEQILNDLPGQVAVFDKNLSYLFLNPASVNDTELRKWMIGKTDFDYCKIKKLDPSIARERQNRLHEAIQLETAQHFEEITLRDGKNEYFTRVISPIFDQNREVKYLIGYGLNITDLKVAQLKLTGSQRQLFAVLNTVGEGIATIDESNNIVMINDEITKIWGYTKEEILGRNIEILLPEYFRENLIVGRSHFLDLNDTRIIGNGVEIEGQRKDGEIFPVEIKIQEMKIEEKTYFTAAIRDITESKKVMEELIQSKRTAEESMKAKEQFLAHMSHEIRTPMNAVVALTQMMLEMNPTLEQQPFLDSIRASAENLLVIINDILDFSKIEAGKIELQMKQFSLRKLVDELNNTAKYISLEKSIQIDFFVEESIPDNLIGDEVRLNQILLNLVSNAIKFTDRGSVMFNCSKISGADDSVLLKFTISDSGTGIPEDKVGSIFNSFEQLSNQGALTKQGTGLGLAIVKKLVELNQGQIYVESVMGVGSKFVVELNFHVGSSIHAMEAIHETNLLPGKIDLSGIKVLIVEDNIMNIFVATKVLQKYGAWYMVAKNGFEALDIFRENDFDVILMDLGMPLMDGYETTTRIRGEFPEPKNRIPIIALTAFASLDPKDSQPETGMTDKLSKPYKPDDLVKKIASVLANKMIQMNADIDSSDSTDLPVTPLIDLSVMSEIGGDDNEFVFEMVTLFLRDTPGYIKAMENEIASGNFKKAADVAHSMKPTLGYVGLTSLEPKFELYNNILKTEKNKVKLQELLNDIKKVIANAYVELREYLRANNR